MKVATHILVWEYAPLPTVPAAELLMQQLASLGANESGCVQVETVCRDGGSARSGNVPWSTTCVCPDCYGQSAYQTHHLDSGMHHPDVSRLLRTICIPDTSPRQCHASSVCIQNSPCCAQAVEERACCGNPAEARRGAVARVQAVRVQTRSWLHRGVCVCD